MQHKQRLLSPESSQDKSKYIKTTIFILIAHQLFIILYYNLHMSASPYRQIVFHIFIFAVYSGTIYALQDFVTGFFKILVLQFMINSFTTFLAHHILARHSELITYQLGLQVLLIGQQQNKNTDQSLIINQLILHYMFALYTCKNQIPALVFQVLITAIMLNFKHYDHQTVIHLRQNLQNTQDVFQKEVDKWKQLVDKFPQGILIINKNDSIYQNQSLSKQIFSPSGTDAVERILQWCMRGTPFGMVKSSLNVLEPQFSLKKEGSSISSIRASNDKISSDLRKSGISKLTNGNRHFSKEKSTLLDYNTIIMADSLVKDVDISEIYMHLNMALQIQSTAFYLSKVLLPAFQNQYDESNASPQNMTREHQQFFNGFNSPFQRSNENTPRDQVDNNRLQVQLEERFGQIDDLMASGHNNEMLKQPQSQKMGQFLKHQNTQNDADNFVKKCFEIQTSKIRWGEEDAILLVLKDVTEVKSFAKIKQSNKYKSMALCTMSHELRTPVHNILNSLHEIKDSIGNKDPQLMMHQKIATSSAIILFHKINDLLDYSLSEQQKLVLETQTVDVKQALVDVIEAFEYQVRLKQLNFHCYFDTNLPQYITSDANKIKQILFNLLQNAQKFTLKGYIKIYVSYENNKAKSASNFRNKGSQVHNYIKFEVEDSGIGIRQQEIPYLFNIFGINKINKEKKNVGLGLSISYILSRRLGQQLVVNSVYGQGSCFSFTIKDNSDSHDLSKATLQRVIINEEQEEEDTNKGNTLNISISGSSSSSSVGESEDHKTEEIQLMHESSYQAKQIKYQMFATITNEKVLEKNIFRRGPMEISQKFISKKNQDLSKFIKDTLAYLESKNNQFQNFNTNLISSFYPIAQSTVTINNMQQSNSVTSKAEEIKASDQAQFQIGQTYMQSASKAPLYSPSKYSRSKSTLPMINFQSNFNNNNMSIAISQRSKKSDQGQFTHKTTHRKQRRTIDMGYQQIFNPSQMSYYNNQNTRGVSPPLRQSQSFASVDLARSSRNQYASKGEQVKYIFNTDMNTNRIKLKNNLRDSIQRQFNNQQQQQQQYQYNYQEGATPRYDEFNRVLMSNQSFQFGQSIGLDTDMNCPTEFDEEEKLLKETNFGVLERRNSDCRQSKFLATPQFSPQFMGNQYESRGNQLEAPAIININITNVDSFNCDNRVAREQQQHNINQKQINRAYKKLQTQKVTSIQQRKMNVIPPIQQFSFEGLVVNQHQQSDYTQNQNLQVPSKRGSAYQRDRSAKNNMSNIFGKMHLEDSPNVQQRGLVSDNYFSDRAKILQGHQSMAPISQNQPIVPQFQSQGESSLFQIQGYRSQDNFNKSAQNIESGPINTFGVASSNSGVYIQRRMTENNNKRNAQEEAALLTENMPIDFEKMQISQLEQRLRQLSQYIANSRQECQCPCVLIAEDDEFIRLVNKTKFMTLGFEVKDVGNGALAVEALEEQEQACTLCEGFLIILMDYDMPVMNGVEATRRIRSLVQENKVSDVPIVAVSAFVASQEIERCINSGMNDYITKPFTQQRLLSVLLQYMTQKLITLQQENQDNIMMSQPLQQ